MSLKAVITDDATGDQGEVDVCDDERNGVVVATRPLKTFQNVVKFFRNDTYGIEMNQNGLFGGTDIPFHNGTDNVYKTFSEPTGTKAIEDSTDQAHAGTKSILWDNGNVGDIFQVAEAGTDITVANYVAFTMWVYIDSDWMDGDSIVFQGYDVGVGYVGNEVKLEDYFDINDLDTWQFIAIPLGDLGLTAGTIDAIRFEIDARAGAKSPKFYIDDLRLEETGDNIIYTIEPDKGTWLHITDMRMLICDEYSMDNADGTVPRLIWLNFLDNKYQYGWVEERYQYWIDKNNPTFTQRYSGLHHVLAIPNWKIENIFSDGGTNASAMLLTQKYPVPVILKEENCDKLQITVQDTLTAMQVFKTSIAGYKEVRPL